MSHPVLKALRHHRILPIIELKDSAPARELGETLIAGGLPIAEVTYRSGAASAAIRALAELPNFIIGAGTILTVAQAIEAIDAGATFLISPGTFPKVIEFALARGIPVFPGVATPTDVGNALAAGATVLKFFPAESMGGLKTLKALSAPFPKVRYIPTGGIQLDNLAGYLAHPATLACGGSWMVDKLLIQQRRWDEIRSRVDAAVSAAQSAPHP